MVEYVIFLAVSVIGRQKINNYFTDFPLQGPVGAKGNKGDKGEKGLTGPPGKKVYTTVLIMIIAGHNHMK